MRVLWELRHGLLSLIGVAVFFMWAMRDPWAFVIPVAFVLIIFPLSWISRSRSLKTQGYAFRWGTSGSSTYEELVGDGTRSLPLPSQWTEMGRPELFIPTREEWATAAPEWAADRRDEIFQRVVSEWNGFDINYPQDWAPSHGLVEEAS